MIRALSELIRRLRTHGKRIFVYGLGGLVALILGIQLLYPHDLLLPYTRIDGLAMGGWQKADATWELDRRYLTKNIAIYFGDNQKPYRTPATGEVGVIATNKTRVDQLHYPLWLRFVPTSLMWARYVQSNTSPQYSRQSQTLDDYIAEHLGKTCDVQAVDADIRFADDRLQVVPSQEGGICKTSDITDALQQVKPNLVDDTSIRIAMTTLPPAVTTGGAQLVVDHMAQRIGEGVTMTAGDATAFISAKILGQWLDFSVNDATLIPQVNRERAGDYLTTNIAPLVARAAGETKVQTMDFIETSRQAGQDGQALDIDATLASLQSYLVSDSADVAIITSPVPPRITYTRNYSPTDTGLSALLANFAHDHPGTFGISLIELGGKSRRATYNENNVFVTASTYKLFVAYSTLRRIDAGAWRWDDANIANGRNLSTCFDDMIVKSDNECAQELLKRVGYQQATNEAREIGLASTSFISGNTPQSTAADEALFLAQLESGQLPLSGDSRTRFLNALGRNIYRRGIPAGTQSTVANKVGFLWGLLHDAAIVYSPTGTYVLVVMTDGSSWQAIADLTRQIESLRSS